jgi:hypothetical protein
MADVLKYAINNPDILTEATKQTGKSSPTGL